MLKILHKAGQVVEEY